MYNKTFKELKALVGKAEGKLPSAKSLKERTDAIAHEVQGNAEATVFLSGHILYTKETMSETISEGHIVPAKVKHSAVYTIERCKEMKMDFYGEMDAETAEDYRQQGLIVKDGCLYIPERMYEHKPWFVVVSMFCEERLDHNQESREEYRSEFSLDNDGNDWDKHTWVEDPLTRMIAEEDAKEDERDLERLREVKAKISPRQLEIVEYKFAHEDMSEKEIGKHFGISQQAVHKNWVAGVKNLTKKF